MYVFIYLYVHIYIYMYILTYSVRKRIFLKTKKMTQSHVRIGDVSLIQNSTKHPQCASEVSGENSCDMLSLKV